MFQGNPFSCQAEGQSKMTEDTLKPLSSFQSITLNFRQ